ncbi:MAG: hypothetical protein GX764_01880 [Firmicutes bacterium]|nr:hypothetical protein [Bacillota bacterium]
MIVKMKKTFMVIQAKDKEATLNSLRELGVLHLEDFQFSSPAVEAVTAERSRVAAAYHFLADFKSREEASPLFSDPREVTEKVLELCEALQEAEDKAISLAKEISDLEKWGDFDPEDFNLLASKGYCVKVYTAPQEQLEQVSDLKGDIVILQKGKVSVTFAVIAREPFSLENFEEFTLPAKSLSTLIAERKQLMMQIKGIKAEASRYHAARPLLKQYMDYLNAELEYEVARANVVEEGNLAAIVGYIPVDQVELVKTWAARQAIGIAITDPAEDDHVPTLIRNPRWLEIIKPVFNFLGTVPGYRELDISLFFLSFFILFFAMIINDAAYGAIFFLGGLGVVLFSKFNKRRHPLVAALFTCLGLATVVWGTLNGSWFGSPELIKGTFLEKLVYPPFIEGFSVYNPSGELYTVLTGQDVIKLLCFVIALIHLTIAQVWNFLQELANRSLKAVAQFAWIGINFGLFYLVLNMVMYFDLDQALGAGGLIGRVSLILILGGLGLVVLFGSQQGNFAKGILAGLGDLLPTALDTVSAFGDLISYIRLFAVGLAGAEIASSFNNMASGLLEGNTFIIGVLILVFGHALNFVLCILGVLVHGIRLNMLEFSGRLGMEWSGREFRPFKKRKTDVKTAT